MTAHGLFRLHFNRHGAAPLIWNVATDDWELAVKSVTVCGVELRTVYRPKEAADDDDGKPPAWLEVTGSLVVKDGHAVIGEFDGGRRTEPHKFSAYSTADGPCQRCGVMAADHG